MKKLLAIILVCVMALSMLPIMASADATALEATPYADGFENWSEQTHLYIQVTIPASEGMAATWKITLNDGTASTTVTLTPVSNYDWGNGKVLYRFQPCLAEGANQFIPATDATYTVSAEVYSGEELTYTITPAADATWAMPAGQEPIIPEVSYDLTIKPEFGGMENWPGSPNKGDAADAYQLLVGVYDYKGAIPASIKSTDQVYTLTITGSDGSSKTITVKPGSIYSTFLVRFETVLQDKENQFIPVAGVNYTVEVSATDADGNTWSGKSADGAFACPEGFVPTVPAEYDYTQTPVDPPVDPVDPPVDPVDPPQAGDATVMIAVLAVVALFGAAVVTKKVFVK